MVEQSQHSVANKSFVCFLWVVSACACVLITAHMSRCFVFVLVMFRLVMPYVFICCSVVRAGRRFKSVHEKCASDL